MKRFLTDGEVQQMLRLTRPVYRNMVNAGTLRAVKLTAKTWVHDEAELEDDE